MSNVRVLHPKQALEAAVRAVEHIMPAQDPKDPRQSLEYVKLKQQLRMARNSVAAAESAETSARISKLTALKFEKELQVELELLEIKLGIPQEEEEES